MDGVAETALRERYLARAGEVSLHRWSAPAVGAVRLVREPAAWQGWRADPVVPPERLERGEELVLDFGEHLVGSVAFGSDGPGRVALEPAEVPAELGDAWEEFPPLFDNGVRPDGRWRCEELDLIGGEQRGRARHAARYLRCRVLDAPAAGLRLHDWRIDATSAIAAPSLPPADCDQELVAIDRLCQATMRSCLQAVFEDGPKRDRRLWLGDLRLQALVDAVTSRRFDLVRRCLYLHAACAREDGLVAACVYLQPEPHYGGEFIPDYAALFAATLADYHTASGDATTARELLAVAERQLDLLLAMRDERGVWRDPGGLWLFVDWSRELHREASEHATLAYACDRLAELADALGETGLAGRMRGEHEALVHAARTWSRQDELFVSGPERQVSVASQLWMILAGAVDPAEGAELLHRTVDRSGVVQPGCPYLQHHLLEAQLRCGLVDDARGLLDRIWGGMVRLGADTCWEVFDPEDPRRSPYRSHLFNSYCHAWSCTPAWFLRHPTYGPLLRRTEASCEA